MQKVTAFLEKYSQWIAVAVGGIYLLLMVYSYLLKPPVTAKLGTETVMPDEIDKRISEGPARDLDRKMADQTPIDFPVPEFVAYFKQDVHRDGQAPYVPPTLVYAAARENEPMVVVTGPGSPKPPPPGTPPTTGPVLASEPKIPTPPAPLAVQVAAGRTVVSYPDQNQLAQIQFDKQNFGANSGGGDNTNGGGEGMATPGTDQPQPGDVPMALKLLQNQPQQNATGGLIQQPVDGLIQTGQDNTTGIPRDLSWVTLSAKVPLLGLARAYANSNLPPQMMSAMFLRVELVRREVLPNGQFGPETVVKTPANSRLPDFPPGTDKGLLAAYKDWAAQNADKILQPPFYDVVAGDPWHLPGVTPEQIANADQQANGGDQPAQFSLDDYIDKKPQEWPKTLTQDQRKQIIQAQYKRRQEDAKARAADRRGQQNDTTGAGLDGSTRGRRESELAADPERLGGLAQAYQPPSRAATPGIDRPAPAPVRPNTAEGANPDQPQGPQADIPTVPNQFDPLQQAQDILFWAHDASDEDGPKPGKTYQYKVRYMMLNPLYTAQGLKDPKLAENLGVWSPFSDWSAPVTIPAALEIQVVQASNFGNAASAKFSIYKWQAGNTMKKDTNKVLPGDIVGLTDGEPTGWTLVDVRRDRDKPYVLLMDPSGKLVRKDPDADRADPHFQDLNKQIEQQKAAQQQQQAASAER